MKLRRIWLKMFFKSHTSPKEWKKYEAVDTWSDSTVNEIIADIANDLRKQLREKPLNINDFDEDFIEYLYEVGYGENDEIDISELAINFAEWVKEAVGA